MVNTDKVRKRRVYRAHSVVSDASKDIVDYIDQNCSTRKKTLAFMKRIGIRKSPSGDLYVVPV